MTRWPTLLEPPVITARIRTEPEDFQVEEIPAYEPVGQGSHLFLWVEKRGLTTEQAIRILAEQAGVSPREMGSAGLKDRWAVTRQWISLPAPARDPFLEFRHPELNILRQSLHGNKLKTGHLKGNRFHIRLRDLEPGAQPELEGRIEQLRRSGGPNYFGPQRFGRQGDNDELGKKILAGRGPRLNRSRLRLVLNAVQSALFNDVLDRRIQAGTLQKALDGDLMIKAESGGQFVCTEPERDQVRMDEMLIHPSGPMFGPKMKHPGGTIEQVERQVLEKAGLDDDCWKRFKKLTQGTRRALRLDLSRLGLEEAPGGLWMTFDLPAGAYATVVLQELVQVEDAQAP